MSRNGWKTAARPTICIYPPCRVTAWGIFCLLKCNTEIELHGIGTEEMGNHMVADVKWGRWDVIAESYGFIIWFCHFLAQLAKMAVEVPSETYIETDTAVAGFVP